MTIAFPICGNLRIDDPASGRSYIRINNPRLCRRLQKFFVGRATWISCPSSATKFEILAHQMLGVDALVVYRDWNGRRPAIR